MGLREIRKLGDDILRKKSRTVDKIDDRIKTLLDDMVETMYHAQGVGLAAPQVGILKRVVVIDVGDERGVLKLINPEIVESEGIQIDVEGCLSVPNMRGNVERPKQVVVRALNENGGQIKIEGTGLLAVALCHEIDHLNGILFVDKIKEDKVEG